MTGFIDGCYIYIIKKIILSFCKRSSSEEIDQKYQSSDVHKKEERYSDNKVRLSDLVPEDEHSEKSTEWAADEGESEKMQLLDAPFAFYGSELVWSVDDKCEKVQCTDDHKKDLVREKKREDIQVDTCCSQ